jgi:hypothetical protein
MSASPQGADTCACHIPTVKAARAVRQHHGNDKVKMAAP